MLASAVPASADSVEVSHTVAVVVVPPVLSIQDDSSSGGPVFEALQPGKDSAPQVVNYRITGNNFSTGALPGIVSAKVEGPENGIQFKADIGAFVNNGTQGNIQLHGAVAGEQVIGDVLVPLADKGPTAGPQAQMLNGTLPVQWKANAVKGISSGNSQTTLTITLKDV